MWQSRQTRFAESSKLEQPWQKLCSLLAIVFCLPACIGNAMVPVWLTSPAVELSIGPVSVEPGSERTVCMTGRLALPKAIDIVRVETQQVNAQRVTFYRFNAGATPVTDTVPSGCLSINPVSGSPLVPLFMAASSAPTQNMLPADLVYHFEANDYYMIEMQIVNTSTTETSSTATVYLTPLIEAVPKSSPG